MPPYGCSSRPPSQRERSSSRPPSPREERGEGAHRCCGDGSDQNGDESNRALDAADDGLPSLLATQAILARPVQPLPALCGERSDCAAIRVRGMAHAQPGSRIHRTCTSMRRCADMVTGQLQGSRTSRVAAPHPDPLPVRTGRGSALCSWRKFAAPRLLSETTPLSSPEPSRDPSSNPARPPSPPSACTRSRSSRSNRSRRGGGTGRGS